MHSVAMKIIHNPHRNTPLQLGAPRPNVNAAPVAALLAQCPSYQPTKLVNSDLAQKAGLAKLWVKDERGRMGLGSFKALGAAYVIADRAQKAGGDFEAALQGEVFVTASAGNHGLSVAAGARVFGAKSVIYLSQSVPSGFAKRLEEQGAEVRIEGADYEQSMQAALLAAQTNGWILLSDSSWPGYFELPHRLMEGYLMLIHEAAQSMGEAPSHIFLQAGVGGLACAVAAYARHVWGETPRIVVVEPDAAPALQASIEAGELVETQGADSSMGRLDCKTASLIALQALSADADDFLTLSDTQVEAQLPLLAEHDLASTPSGGAGLAALLSLSEAERADLGIDANARILTILSEAQ